MTPGTVVALLAIFINPNGARLEERNITLPNFTLDLSVYANGNYYLIIQSKDGELVQSLKLIKQ